MFPTQRMPELRAFAMMARGTAPYPFMVELGTDTGESARFFSSYGIRVISIDMKNRDELHSSAGQWRATIQFVRGMSYDEGLAEDILSRQAVKLNAVFVDASHEYEDVKKDFEVWWPRLAKGGIMGFHDICQLGVDMFWSEASWKYPSIEIHAADEESEKEWQAIAPGEPSGIGVLFKE